MTVQSLTDFDLSPHVLSRIELNVDSTSSNQSSGRSSVSSIGSVSMLQSGIYQVHSRRGSQESVDSLPEFSWAEEDAPGQDGIARPKFDLVSDPPTSADVGKEDGVISSLISSQEATTSGAKVVTTTEDNVEHVESFVSMQEKRDNVENVESLALKEQTAAVESESSASDPEKTSMHSCDSGNSDGANVSPRSSGAKMAAGGSEVAGASDSGTGEEVLEDDVKTEFEPSVTMETSQVPEKYQMFSPEVENVDSMPLFAIETTGTNSQETPDLTQVSEEARVEVHRSEEVRGQRAQLDRFANVDLEADELVVQREGKQVKGRRKKKKRPNSADISNLSLSEGSAVESQLSDLRSAFQQKMSTLKTGRLSSDSDTPEGGATPELSSSPVVQQQLKVMKDKLSTRLQDSRSKLATKSKSLMKAIQESEQIGRIRQTIRRPDAQADRGNEDDDVFEDAFGGNQDNSISMATDSAGQQVGEERRGGAGPRVDVTVLLQATRDTSEKLKDPEVLFDPDLARTVLSAWLPHLETALQNLCRTVREHNAKVRSRSEVKGQVSEVVEDSVPDRTDPSNGCPDVENMQQGKLETEGQDAESMTLEEGVEESVIPQDSPAECDSVLEGEASQNKAVTEHRTLGEGEDRVSENDIDGKVVTLNSGSPEGAATSHAKTEEDTPVLLNNHEMHSQDETSKEDHTPKNNAENPQEMEDFQEVVIQEGFHVLDPFLLKEDSHAEISELVTLCFQFGIFKENGTSSQSKDMPVSLHVIGQDGTGYNNPDVLSQSESVLQQEAPESDRTYDDNSSFSSIGPHSKERQHLSSTSQSASLSHEEEEWDRSAAQFLKCHFHFLDVEAVRKTLQHRRGPRTKVWDRLLQCLNALHSEGAVPDLVTRGDVEECLKLVKTKELTDGGAVLSCLHSVFLLSPEPVLDTCVQIYPQLSPEPVLDTCVQIYPQVQPWEVAQFCQDSPQHFLYYIHKIQALPRHRQSELLQSLYGDESVLLQWLNSALTVGAPDRGLLFTGQGEPRPGSHQLPWPHSADVEEILTHFSRESGAIPHSSAEREHLVNMCRKAGYWQGYLRLCKGFGHRQEALRTAVLLGDVRLLDPQHDPSVPPKSLEEWEEVFRLMLQLEAGQGSAGNSHGATLPSQDSMQEIPDPRKQSENPPVPYDNDSSDATLSPNDRTSKPNVESNNTSDWLPKDQSIASEQARDWSPGITWEEAGRLLVSSVGPDQGIEVLRRLPVPAGRLTEGFYRSCVLASMMHRRQRLLIHSMLEKVDTYLWSKRPTTLSPELYYAMQQEKQAQQAQSRGTPVSVDRSL
ncbi:Hermansky-Pudlak syndrome 5, partial [Branchiostoma belcheri]